MSEADIYTEVFNQKKKFDDLVQKELDCSDNKRPFIEKYMN